MVPHRDDCRAELSPDDPRLSLLQDLQASLTVISGNAQTLERWLRDGRQQPPEVTLALVTLIAASVRDMARLLRQLETDET